jgi:hypothetical protein
MEPNRCHDNVSELWKGRGPRSRLFAIVTGYALTDDDSDPDDGIWRPHSWALSRTAGRILIIETTLERSQYFGLILDGQNADIFANL